LREQSSADWVVIDWPNALTVSGRLAHPDRLQIGWAMTRGGVLLGVPEDRKHGGPQLR